MNITPVFDDPNAVPIWKLEGIEIPKFIEKACTQDTSWISYPIFQGWDKIPGMEGFVAGMKDRYLHEENVYCNHKLSKIGTELVEFLKTQKDYDFDDDFPSSTFNEKLETNRFKFDTVKDGPRFRQTPHVDNRYIMCTALINLADNAEGAGTYYYDYFDFYTQKKERIIYQGPSKKGTGLLHVNTCRNLHEGWNNTDSDRFIAFGNMPI